MRAQLILEAENGSRREGRLRNGAYLVGRSRSCQIRPPFRSISRRHCILLNLPQRLSVVDLGSSAGTFVNGNLIAPGVEAELRHGDELRIGDVAFQLAVFSDEIPELVGNTVSDLDLPEPALEESPRPSVPVPAPTQATRARVPTVPLSGDSNEINPMAGDDVADWLLGLDESDRGDRMQSIKKKFNLSDDPAADDADEDDLDFEVDARAETTEKPNEPSRKQDQSRKQGTAKHSTDTAGPAVPPSSSDDDPATNRTPPHGTNGSVVEPTSPESSQAPKRTPTAARSRSGPGLASTLSTKIKENPDSFKLALLTLAAIAVFGWAAFYTYSTFFAGPSVEVFTEI